MLDNDYEDEDNIPQYECIPEYDPEDCEECGCDAGEFGDEDWDNGHYTCPQCGAVC